MPSTWAKLDIDQAIADLAARQHGVVARAQLLVRGVDTRSIAHRLDHGRLHRVHRGVYAVGHSALSPDGHAMAAVLLGGPKAVLSHRAAGGRWRLCPPRSTALEVTTPRRCEDRPHVKFHQVVLPTDEVSVLHGIPVTSMPRTLLDLAGVLDRHRLERAMNEAEVQRLTDRLSLDDLMRRHPKAPGIRTLREILATASLGTGVTRGELEARFLAFLDRHGIARPQLNAPLQLGDAWVEVDCLWRDQRLIVELDGRATHGTRTAFERDRACDRRLQMAGWRVVRVTWRQLHLEPERIAADLRVLLAA